MDKPKSGLPRRDYEAALQHFRNAIRYGHDKFWMRYNRAELFRQIGDFRAALEDIETAVALNVQHAAARERLDDIKRESGGPVLVK